MASQESEVGPLQVLGWLLKRGPPLLSALRGWIGGYEEYNDFVLLIREFLPEHEAEILRAGGLAAQIAVFADHFETRYFPLAAHYRDGIVEEYYDLTRGIIVDVQGLDWDDYTQPDVFAPEYQLMAYLVQSNEEGRTPLAEECARLVPVSLLERVGDGFPLEDLRSILTGTRFEGLADWAAIWCHETGVFVLDATYEDLCYEAIEWSRENVEALTEEWQRSDLIMSRVREVAGWLGDDLSAHFTELLDFIEERIANASRTDAVPVGPTGGPRGARG